MKKLFILVVYILLSAETLVVKKASESNMQEGKMLKTSNVHGSGIIF